MRTLHNKKAQEEMVGFTLIIILVAVILLVFLGFSLRSPQKDNIESYEVESFILTSLQTTSECQNYLGYLTIKDLISECEEGKTCLNGGYTCEILNSTLKNILKRSWNIEENSIVKGYKMSTEVDEVTLLNLSKGNITNNLKGDTQSWVKKGKKIQINLDIFY